MEYVPALNRRSKWQMSSEQQLRVGDLIFIVEESNPMDYCPTVWIEELRYGADSVTRSAAVRTLSGSLVVLLVKLVPILPTSIFGPEDINE